MRTIVCFSFNKIRRWLLDALCFGSGWKGRADSVPYKLHILIWLSIITLKIHSDNMENIAQSNNSDFFAFGS